MSKQPTHNLDIKSYNLYELLELFDLSDIHNVSLDDLKRAKKRVLMLHPDKSKLSSDYFLFYKKAFDVIIRMFDNVQKVSQIVEDQDYNPEITRGGSNVDQVQQIQKSIQKMPKDSFQKEFNTLFEKHMKTPVNSERNAWFTQENALYDETITSSGQITTAIDRIKEKQQALVKHREIAPIQHMNWGVNSLYGDQEQDNEEYISADLFSKLKFDDLRKVHKDETVFSVRESDFDRVPQYRSVNDYERARNVHNIQPMEKTQAQQMMEDQEKMLQQKMREKQYQSQLSSMKYADANKEVMSNFLRLQH